MLTYYGGQLGITLSIVNSYENHEINYRVIQHQDLIKCVKLIYYNIKSIYLDMNFELFELNAKFHRRLIEKDTMNFKKCQIQAINRKSNEIL